jgi:sarcosine/dimethylglycine N-methyltransferase
VALAVEQRPAGSLLLRAASSDRFRFWENHKWACPKAVRAGQSEQLSFETTSALDLPFGDGHFDVVLLQHVAMTIADRPRLYREIRRVLKPGGRFAIFDVVSNGGAPHYPVHWARTPATSFLWTAVATRKAIEPAGFRTPAWQDDTEAAKAWTTQLRPSGPLPSRAKLSDATGRQLISGTPGRAANVVARAVRDPMPPL